MAILCAQAPAEKTKHQDQFRQYSDQSKASKVDIPTVMSFFGERVSDAYGLGLGLEFFEKVLTTSSTTLEFAT